METKRRPLFGDSLERLQGSPDLQMPPALAEAMTDHLEELREKYVYTLRDLTVQYHVSLEMILNCESDPHNHAASHRQSIPSRLLRARLLNDELWAQV